MKPLHGMLLGKFMPPHLGHQYLVDFARDYVQHLTVLLYSLDSDPVPGSVREEWMREMFPSVELIHTTAPLPQAPSEHPEFWPIWTAHLADILPQSPDCVFASEPYGSHLAEVVGARYVPVDHRRELVPVSATEVRNDPIAHWPYLPSCVRPYYVRRVCLFGPESTGKTALARKLAAHYDTRCVLEYARPLLDFKEGRCDPEDIPRIANGQLASEAALARQANRVLFCDTDVLTTAIWSDVLFGTCPEWVRAAAERQTYDLYLLMDTDIEWEDDGQRFLRAERHLLLERYRRALEGRDRPYLKVSGDYPARFEIARAAVDELLGSGLPGRGPAPVTRARRR